MATDKSYYPNPMRKALLFCKYHIRSATKMTMYPSSSHSFRYYNVRQSLTSALILYDITFFTKTIEDFPGLFVGTT